ncbi:hypothetical protein D3C72_2177680 [compost metagenome]
MAADFRLLFKGQDFWHFHDSEIRRDLMCLSEEIKILVKKLDSYLASHLQLDPI